jgi:hypothetical protein
MTDTQTAQEHANARAHLGASLLDTLRPGWERLIDPDTLDVENVYLCVLAQVYDTGFGEALDEVSDAASSGATFSWADARTYGFQARLMPSGMGVTDMDDYERLRTAWLEEINVRFAAGTAPR